MLHTHIATQIYNNFGFPPTLEQKNIIEALGEYLSGGDPTDLFIVNGYAGTGKTTLIAALVRTLTELRVPCFLMAPTGRAAKVMSIYSGTSATTIHKRIYRRRQASASGGVFSLNLNKAQNAVFIVDEASMLSNDSFESSAFGTGCLIDDMFEFIHQKEGNRLILVGDDAQLPPVGLDRSPALNGEYMCRYGTVHYHTMSQVVRQAIDSPVLANATAIRVMLESGELALPKFVEERDGFVRLSGADLIESIEDSYRQVGQDETIIITRSNKRANLFNGGIRRQVLDVEGELEAGDRLMVVKNNYYVAEQDKECPLEFIANGDVAVVERVIKTRELYGFNFATVLLSLPDYNDYQIEAEVLLDTLHSESPSLTRPQQEALFSAIEEDYAHIGEKRQRIARVMQNKYFNALQVKFGYAVTCHKAQGGQWKHVYLDQMLFGGEGLTRDFQRWLYTALTRAQIKVHMVNWHDDYFV